MQLIRSVVVAALLVIGCAASVQAQSLSPMRKSGATPTDIKGFRLTVGNPYDRRMRFELIPMEPGFVTRASHAQVNPPELVLAPDYARQVVFMFKIPAPMKERTIGLCIQPKDVEGPVLPRVCGTYHGELLTAGTRRN